MHVRRGREWWTPKRRDRYAEAWRRFERRSRAARRGWRTRKAKEELERIKRRPKGKRKVELPPPPPAPERPQVWEVTAEYPAESGDVVEITVRMESQQPGHWPQERVLASAWYAVQHGATALKAWKVEAIDWHNTYARGGGKRYRYTAGTKEVLESARGVFVTLGMAKLRVALVEE